jgi:hypothetical protein
LHANNGPKRLQTMIMANLFDMGVVP